MSRGTAVNGAFSEIQRLAAPTGQTIYDICHRRAGWGIQWHDARLVKTPPPPEMVPGKNWPLVSAINQKRLREGLVIYHYYPTIAKCLVEEKKRLVREAKQAPGS